MFANTLLEELEIRGLIYTENFFPSEYFSNDTRDDKEKYLQTALMTEWYRTRILWVVYQIALKKTPPFILDSATPVLCSAPI
jgi:hypothetical protein